MNLKIFYSILSILLGGFLIVQNSLDFNPIRFHCTNYILNSYLYLFISIAIVFTTLFTLDHTSIDVHAIFNSNTRFILILLCLIIFPLTLISPKYFLTKHLLWITFISMMTIFIFPIYKYQADIFYHSALTTFGLVVALSMLSFYKQDLVTDSWSFYLVASLIALILSQIVEIILTKKGIIKGKTFKKSLSYISILVFSAFIVYDTRQIITKSKECVNPDYINQSLNILLDTFNIFTNVTNIKE